MQGERSSLISLGRDSSQTWASGLLWSKRGRSRKLELPHPLPLQLRKSSQEWESKTSKGTRGTGRRDKVRGRGLGALEDHPT